MIKKITFRGTDITNDTDHSGFSVSYQLDEKTKSVEVGTTSELIFTGAAYEHVRSFHFQDPKNQYTLVSEVYITVDCCGERTYRFVADAEGLTHCPTPDGQGCSIRANLRHENEKYECYNQLGDKIFWKDNGLTNQIMNNDFFIRQNFIQSLSIWNWVVYYLWFIVKAIPFISVIQLIDNIFGSGNNVFNRVEDWITGAGNFNIAFNVRRAIKHNTGLCGLAFISKILNNEPYSRMYMLSAQYQDGIDIRFKNNQTRILELWNENGINKTTLQLLDDLKPVFDAEYRLVGNTLYFDKLDDIRSTFPRLFDISEQVTEDDTGYCIRYQQLVAYAYGRFEYKLDPVETRGNKAGKIYNDIVEWNKNPINSFQRDELAVSIDFAPTAFQDDELTISESIEETAFLINNLRRTNAWGRAHRNEIFLSAGYTGLPKLIIYGNDYTPARFPLPNSLGLNLFRYNEDMRFIEDQPTLNLFRRYHIDRNPRARKNDFFEIDGFEAAITCEMLDLLDEFGINMYIETPYGRGYFDQYEIDFSAGVIKFEKITI